MKVRILLNPRAAAGRAARLLEPLRRASGPGAELLVPESAEETRALARSAGAEGVEALVAVGGDGTVHQALAGLAGGGPPLAILPAGRGNDIAASLGLRGPVERAFDLVRRGRPAPFDLGRAGEAVFGGVAGVGFDAEVTRCAAEAPARRGGLLDYLEAVVRVARRFEPPAIRVLWEGGLLEGPRTLVALANVPRYGGGFRVAPGADPSDGLLDLVAVDPLSRLRLLSLVPTAIRGTHLGKPWVVHRRVRELRLESEAPLESWADGEYLGRLPLEVRVLPAAVTVLLPAP
jgi:diacylglycerol kinase (ATP)